MKENEQTLFYDAFWLHASPGEVPHLQTPGVAAAGIAHPLIALVDTNALPAPPLHQLVAAHTLLPDEPNPNQR